MPPWTVYIDGTNGSYIHGVEGEIITYTLNGVGIAGSSLTPPNGDFEFSGPIGIKDLPSAPWASNNTFPGFTSGGSNPNNTWKNNGPDATVYLSVPSSGSGSGSFTDVWQNGTYAGFATPGVVTHELVLFVPAGGEFAVAGSGTVTFRIGPARATYDP